MKRQNLSQLNSTMGCLYQGDKEKCLFYCYIYIKQNKHFSLGLSLKNFSTEHCSIHSAMKNVSKNYSEEISSKGLHSRCQNADGGHSIRR